MIPLLWRAQEQEGWLSRPAIESVADMLDMAYIRVLEVASFYFMFQLQPVGSVAHIQVCGTTSCMICGAEDLIAVCKEKIAAKPHELSADGKLSWEEVECLGSCTNAPMAQIGKDYYEDLTAESFGKIIDDLSSGKVPVPGPQNGRYAAEPLKGLTSLSEHGAGKPEYNASVELATGLADTVKRIDGTEVPVLTPWLGKDGKQAGASAAAKPPKVPEQGKPAARQAAPKKSAKAEPSSPEGAATKAETAEVQPETLSGAREGKPDDLKLLKGVGPKLEQTLNELGFYHFDQIAAWTPEQVAWVDARLKVQRPDRTRRLDRTGGQAGRRRRDRVCQAGKVGRQVRRLSRCPSGAPG